MPKKVSWTYENVKMKLQNIELEQSLNKATLQLMLLLAEKVGLMMFVLICKAKANEHKKVDKSSVSELAKMYHSKVSFRKENRGAYAASCKNGWLTEIYAIIETNPEN